MGFGPKHSLCNAAFPKAGEHFQKGRRGWWGRHGVAQGQASGSGTESQCPWQGRGGPSPLLVRSGSTAPPRWPQAEAASACCSCRTTMGATIRPTHGAVKVPQIMSCWQLRLPTLSGCKVCAPPATPLPVLGPGSPAASLKEEEVPAL